MNSKSFLLLTVAAAAAVAGAYLITRDGGASEVSGAEQGPLFPGLRESVNDVARVVVRQGEETVDVELQDGAWVLADRGGYPATFEEVKETILQVADLTIDEVKTANPELFDQLGLQDPGPDATTPKEVALYDAAGERLAAVVVGKAPRGSRDAAFVRRSDEEQTYQADGNVDASTRLADWTTTDVLKLPAADVSAVMITHPDGETLSIRRGPSGDPLVDALPEGRELSYATAPNPVLSALASVQFDDVRPAAELELPGDATTRARFQRDDGLVVEVALAEVEGKWWAKLTPSFDPSVRTAPTPPEDFDVAAEDTTGDDASSEGEEATTEPDPAAEARAAYEAELAAYEAAVEAARADAERLAGELEGWAYALADYRAGNLTKRVEDLLKPLSEEDATGASDAPSDADLERLLREAGIDPAALADEAAAADTSGESPVEPDAGTGGDDPDDGAAGDGATGGDASDGDSGSGGSGGGNG